MCRWFYFLHTILVVAVVVVAAVVVDVDVLGWEYVVLFRACWLQFTLCLSFTIGLRAMHPLWGLYIQLLLLLLLFFWRSELKIIEWNSQFNWNTFFGALFSSVLVFVYQNFDSLSEMDLVNFSCTFHTCTFRGKKTVGIRSVDYSSLVEQVVWSHIALKMSSIRFDV